MQALYAYFQADEQNLTAGKNTLRDSMLALHDEYLFLLDFPYHFSIYLEGEKQAEKSKYYPDKSYIRLCSILEKTPLTDTLHNASLLYKRKFFSSSWESFQEVFEKLFEEIKDLDFVKDYLIFDAPDFQQQQYFIEMLYQYMFESSELFHDSMEDIFGSWNDDEPLLTKEVMKTVLSCKMDGTLKLTPAPGYLNEEVQFGLLVFEKTISQEDQFNELIEQHSENWDSNRIALIDAICIKMALAEFLHCKEIPVKVTINEYLEIIKNYSTPNSSRFVNGVLDKIRMSLQENGKMQKIGRGLKEK